MTHCIPCAFPFLVGGLQSMDPHEAVEISPCKLTPLPGMRPDEQFHEWISRMSLARIKLPGFPRGGQFQFRRVPERWEDYSCYHDIIRMSEGDGSGDTSRTNYSVTSEWGGELLGILPCKVPLIRQVFERSLDDVIEFVLKGNPLVQTTKVSICPNDYPQHYDWLMDAEELHSLKTHIKRHIHYQGISSNDERGMRQLKNDILAKTKNKSSALDLSLVINLTATPRYTDTRLYRDNGMEHIQIAVQGGGKVPDPSYVWDFLSAMRSAGKVAPRGGVVMVHCTHGVNRTGFFICLWLMIATKMRVNEALDLFKQRRGHAIDKPELIELLNSFDLQLNGMPFKEMDSTTGIKIRVWQQIGNLMNAKKKTLAPIQDFCSTTNSISLTKGRSKTYYLTLGPLPSIFGGSIIMMYSMAEKLLLLVGATISRCRPAHYKGEFADQFTLELTIECPQLTAAISDMLLGKRPTITKDPYAPSVDPIDPYDPKNAHLAPEPDSTIVSLIALMSFVHWNATIKIPESEMAYDYRYEAQKVAGEVAKWTYYKEGCLLNTVDKIKSTGVNLGRSPSGHECIELAREREIANYDSRDRDRDHRSRRHQQQRNEPPTPLLVNVSSTPPSTPEDSPRGNIAAFFIESPMRTAPMMFRHEAPIKQLSYCLAWSSLP